MPAYKAPVEDMMFLLSDVFHIIPQQPAGIRRGADRRGRGGARRRAAKFGEEVLQPLNRVGDKEGCRRHDDGRVTTPTGFKEAYRRLPRAAGSALGADRIRRPGPAAWRWRSGQRIPGSANMAFAMYPGLTQGAVGGAACVHGIAEQKALYLPKLIDRRMDRHDEPDRAAMRHRSRPDRAPRAVPQADGSYDITGTKIFISAGEHDLAENIVHLVLARIEGAPAGVKGISLFIVPEVPARPKTARSARATASSCGSIEAEDGHPRQFHLRDEL